MFGAMPYALGLEPHRPPNTLLERSCQKYAVCVPCCSYSYSFDLTNGTFGSVITTGTATKGCCGNVMFEIPLNTLAHMKLEGEMYSSRCIGSGCQPRTIIKWKNLDAVNSERGTRICTLCGAPELSGHIGSLPKEESMQTIRYARDLVVEPPGCGGPCCNIDLDCCPCGRVSHYTSWNPPTVRSFRNQLISDHHGFHLRSYVKSQYSLGASFHTWDTSAIGNYTVTREDDVGCCALPPTFVDRANAGEPGEITAVEMVLRASLNQNAPLSVDDFALALGYLLMEQHGLMTNVFLGLSPSFANQHGPLTLSQLFGLSQSRKLRPLATMS